MSMLEDNQWYGTMFPRIPAKHLNEIRKKIREIRGAGNQEQTRNVRSGNSTEIKNRRDRSKSPQHKKKRRDPRDLDSRPSTSR